MKEIKLSINTVNGILEYLSNQPFKEVYQLIGAIQQEANNNIENEKGKEIDINKSKKDK